MFEKRKEWVNKRFGNIDENILGKIEETKGITWPDVVKVYDAKGQLLKYQMVRDIEESAERVADIFRNSADEMIGNSEFEWHHNPGKIIEMYRTGDWNFYGCYFEEKLISVSSMHIIRGQRAIQWIYGCVDPAYRGMGVWHYMGEYFDMIVYMSGAQMGFFSVVTSHKYSQMTAEKAGFRPMGCFVGGSFYGGSDGRYFRQSMIYYGKLYDDSKKHLQKWETMELTEKAEKLVKTVKELWADVI